MKITKEELYRFHLDSKRALSMFRRRRYERRCREAGMQPLSRSRINLVQIVVALALPALISTPFYA